MSQTPGRRMFVFDIDGVLTDPEDSRVSTEALKFIVEDLRQGSPVALNTGRPLEWVDELILSELRKLCPDDAFNNLLVVAEMGGVVCRYNDGKPLIEVDEQLSLPGDFSIDIITLLRQRQPDGSRWGDYVWWDDNKRTMGSLVKHDYVSISEFNRVRSELAEALGAIMSRHNADDFKLGQTTTATDIQHESAGKHKGARAVLKWVEARGDDPERYYAFGDSVSDKAMAETFSAAGTPTTFVFVGDSALTPEVQSDGYSTVVMSGGHVRDTTAYLDGLRYLREQPGPV